MIYASRMSTFACGVVIAAMSSNTALADCATRHFYNNSPVSFIFAMGKGTGSCSYRLPETGKDSGMQSLCVFPPHSVGEIHYANTTIIHVIQALSQKGSAEPGQVLVKTDDGGQVYNHSFSVNTDSCYIDHSGGTGHIAVNDPAKGDINTCNDKNWSCH
jgi:hypothetical protein